MSEFKWTEDEEGDHLLDVDGDYFGLVCPHHKGHVKLAWEWGTKSATAATVEEGKRMLKREAIEAGAIDSCDTDMAPMAAAWRDVCDLFRKGMVL